MTRVRVHVPGGEPDPVVTWTTHADGVTDATVHPSGVLTLVDDAGRLLAAYSLGIWATCDIDREENDDDGSTD